MRWSGIVLAFLFVISSDIALSQEPVKVSEKVLSTWPDGTVKTTGVRFSDGTRIEYRNWENGNRRWEFRYDERGKQHGTSTRWHPNGTLFVEEQWERGKKTGAWIYHTDDGRKNARFTWKDDREVNHEVWSQPEGKWVPFEKK